MDGNLSFSVIMSVYKNDNEEHFDRAIQSISVDQTIMPNEIVLIVDGFVTDGINEVIKKYEQQIPFFRVIRLKENVGLGNALRIAIEQCKYEWVARMDSDDISIFNRFEQQIKYIKEHPDIDIVGGNIAEFILEESNVVSHRNVPMNDEDIKKYLKKRCPFNHVSVMYKRSTIIEVGGYIDWFWNEDYYLWIRMFQKKCIFANTGTILVNVRVSEDMYKRRGGWKYFKSEIALQIYMLKNRIIELPVFLSNCCKRFVVQVLLPNDIRSWVFKNFARD